MILMKCKQEFVRKINILQRDMSANNAEKLTNFLPCSFFSLVLRSN